ncbi:MAG: PDZ domain-containing protein [Akkermansiaceae bacterium]|nr:PDZ domain-containing protein [Akkermansiaceae bacterium]
MNSTSLVKPWRQVFAVWCASVFTLAAQSTAPVPPIPGQLNPLQTKAVQLGVTVAKPGAAVYAQLPGLPRGTGFLLQSVTAGGTVDVAGLKPMDVIWKLGDQLLINENQLMTLLALHRPGDEVTVSYFHSGVEKSATLLLQASKPAHMQPGDIAITPPFPGAPAEASQGGYSKGDSNGHAADFPALPMRVISYEDRSASISDNNGTATLIFREGKPWLHVETSQGVETYNGPVGDAEAISRVPIAWRSRLPILQRSLEESIRLRRLPRVRRVPTPKQRIAGGE